MGENFIMPIILSLLAVTAGLSWFIMRLLGDRWARPGRIFVAGISPFILILLAIGIWHYVELREYQASESQEGFMGPLLILLYGFPYFIVMLVIDFAVAASFKKPK